MVRKSLALGDVFQHLSLSSAGPVNEAKSIKPPVTDGLLRLLSATFFFSRRAEDPDLLLRELDL